jgi:predicted metal-binding membrane protein
MDVLFSTSKAPITLLLFFSIAFSEMNHKRNSYQHPCFSTMAFLSGYLMIWAIFGLIAALTEWVIYILSIPNNQVVLSLSLFCVGFYQFTASKRLCLIQCRNPHQYFENRSQVSNPAHVWLGIHQGVCCLGCCWTFMALLMVLGTSNLLWMITITIFISVERINPHSTFVRRSIGILFLLLGIGSTFIK